VNQAIRAASALNCKINKDSYFERKHYCYQDLPLGYQITQQARPIAENGRLDFDVHKEGVFTHKASVGITRIQLEQDSGKSLYNTHPSYTLVDLNRAGVALLEIVFEPELRSPEEAASALRAIQKLFRHINICDGNMQEGSMRCDVNVSVEESEESCASRGGGERIAGGRVEVKNINSMSSVTAAARIEARRHIELLERGERIPRETRGYDAGSDSTHRMRSKETAVDYRIFRDPDLPPLLLSDEDIQRALDSAQEGLEATAARLMANYGLDSQQVDMLVTHQAVRFFEASVLVARRKVGGEHTTATAAASAPASVYKWLFGDLMGNLNTYKLSVDECPVTPAQLVDVIDLVESSKISGPQAKTLLKDLFDDRRLGADPAKLVVEYGWEVISDRGSIDTIIEEVINDPNNAKMLQKYLSGNARIAKFFFGEVMRVSKGQVDPKTLDGILETALTAEAKKRGASSS
jgi:aspartyl-tRNA(Asn)/glutamyl-tRNA(Gln) amidotransferase subunit B